MKRSIAIQTIDDKFNYGNRLQNYALKILLKKYGNTYNLYKHTFKTRIRFFIKIFSLFNFLKPLISFNYIKNCLSFDLRFTSNKKPKEYSNLILGSDQIWNYRWISSKELMLCLGSFASQNVSIISYAASFGVSEISDDVKPIFQKYLPCLRAISVREDRGKELVEEMTGLQATVVLDPTLMMTANQWDRITHGFVPDGDRYVLTYFLGRPNEAQERTILEYAAARGCRIRRILDLRDLETYVAGPQDFVELFSKAEYVFTDSYHACCFSILYHKQFTVFNRVGMRGNANMNSRMETLFRLFDLGLAVMDEGVAPQIDYAKVDRLLARHRLESQAWLDKAMEA